MPTITKSTKVTNMTTVPRIINPGTSGRGIKFATDSVTVPDTGDGDIVICGFVATDAYIEEVEFTCADLGSAGTVDIGFYKEVMVAGEPTFAAVDDDCIAASLDLSVASAIALAPQRFAGLAADTLSPRAWQVAGLTSKPDYAMFYIGLTTDTGTTTTGTATVNVKYT